MTELTIESVPSGAQVQIDGEIIGTTPLTYTIGEVAGLEEFRAECVHGGSVTCSWDVLKTRLEDQTVSRLWWDLTRDERYSVGEKTIKNTLFFYIAKIRKGKPDCEGGEGEYEKTNCIDNAVLKYLSIAHTDGLITDKSSSIDRCYWQHPTTHEEHCIVPDISYNLPCFFAVYYLPGNSHVMCALQIDHDLTTLDSFIIFQYSDFDLKSGSGLLSAHEKLAIGNPAWVICRGLHIEPIVEFIV